MNCTKVGQNAKRKPIISLVALAITLCALLSVCLSACNKHPYETDNNLGVEVIDTDDALTFAPKKFKCSYGVIIYVGALIEPARYTYLGTALARQGYLTVIPKFSLNMSAANYTKEEPAFAKYPNVKFFIAGHDQGGGAAIRRAQENPDNVAGVLLYSPLIVPRIILDEEGRPSKDEDGNWLYSNDTISSLNLPTLWIESDDVTRSEDVRNNIQGHLNMSTVTEHTIANSTALGFSSSDSQNNLTEGGEELTEEEKTALENRQSQLDSTVKYTLTFLKSCVC